MVSLTTVYILSIILTSLAGFGSAFAANKMTGGGTTSEDQTMPTESPPPSIEQTEPEVQPKVD